MIRRSLSIFQFSVEVFCTRLKLGSIDPFPSVLLERHFLRLNSSFVLRVDRRSPLDSTRSRSNATAEFPRIRSSAADHPPSGDFAPGETKIGRVQPIARPATFANPTTRGWPGASIGELKLIE
jgi:hypothetical protein